MRVQWMRWDQTGWDHYGLSHMYDVTMGADATGKIVVADWQTYGQAQSNIDETRRALGQVTWGAVPGRRHRPPTVAPRPNSRTTPRHTVPAAGAREDAAAVRRAFKCNFLRAPSAPQQYFASEQIVDELAHAVNMDPVAFRRKNIDASVVAGARWLAVLDASTIAAGWKPKVAASNLQRATSSPAAASASASSRHPGRHRCRRPGEQEDGQDRREAPLGSPRTTASRRPPARRQPDERLAIRASPG